MEWDQNIVMFYSVEFHWNYVSVEMNKTHRMEENCMVFCFN